MMLRVGSGNEAEGSKHAAAPVGSEGSRGEPGTAGWGSLEA